MTTVKAAASSRWVSGMPAYAGAATAERDARHDLERNAGRVQRLRLLAAAPEDERVAALQADDALSGSRLLDRQSLDLALLHRVRAAALPDENALARRRREGDDRVGDERIV